MRDDEQSDDVIIELTLEGNYDLNDISFTKDETMMKNVTEYERSVNEISSGTAQDEQLGGVNGPTMRSRDDNVREKWLDVILVVLDERSIKTHRQESAIQVILTDH